jgi:hypothetical protein
MFYSNEKFESTVVTVVKELRSKMLGQHTGYFKTVFLKKTQIIIVSIYEYSILSKNNVDIISLEGLNRYEQNIKYPTCSILWHLYKCTMTMHIVKLSNFKSGEIKGKNAI